MPTGKVKWFNNAKGYGFVNEQSSDEDLFVHYSSIEMDGYKTLKAGQPVIFETKNAENGVHAINVTLVDEPQEADPAPQLSPA